MRPPEILRRSGFPVPGCIALAVCWLAWGAGRAQAVDLLVDNAVRSVAILTDPQRLLGLPEEQFPAQLGPALGWLHVARRQDVSPESVIARAFARNGLAGERARLTREALLRNLARADAWELFANAASARALAAGLPAPIAVGMHRGHLAQAAVVLPEGLGEAGRREFACLVLRADDELPPVRRPPYLRLPGDRLVIRRKAEGGRRKAAAVSLPAVPVSYDEPLPVE